jgi:hypothetical protein
VTTTRTPTSDQVTVETPGVQTTLSKEDQSVMVQFSLTARF